MSRLSIMQILNESINLLLRERRFFVALIIGPVLVLTGTLSTVQFTRQSPAGIAAAILLFVVLVFSSVRIAVCCHRFILLGEKPSSFMQGCKWEKRDTWFAWYGVAIYLFAGFCVFLAAMGAAVLSPFLQLLPKWAFIILFALGFISMSSLFSYLMGRLSLILPATAIDRKPSQDWMDWAWSQSEGNVWPLMFLLGVNPAIGSMMLDDATNAMIAHASQSSVFLATPIYGIVCVLYFSATIFQVAVLSFSLKKLSADRIEVTQKSLHVPDLNLQTQSPV